LFTLENENALDSGFAAKYIFMSLRKHIDFENAKPNRTCKCTLRQQALEANKKFKAEQLF